MASKSEDEFYLNINLTLYIHYTNIVCMEITWDPQKQKKLMLERGIDLEEIKGLIEHNDYLDILENAKKPGQYMIVLEYKSYVHIVPIIVGKEEVVLKTCYPSRKANKKYKEDKK